VGYAIRAGEGTFDSDGWAKKQQDVRTVRRNVANGVHSKRREVFFWRSNGMSNTWATFFQIALHLLVRQRALSQTLPCRFSPTDDHTLRYIALLTILAQT
jgi:hypothetical protein